MAQVMGAVTRIATECISSGGNFSIFLFFFDYKFNSVGNCGRLIQSKVETKKFETNIWTC